ncbi:hypothetical protein CDAR_102891 [Caerostris darwini]|uniref:Uncharacterized protein n=1 Tax=Caerostris darwini TaxID=1538125 RepID=A0AAV4MJV0_9ARAC|nr:hypothetical protein CDAR_102891 [Caerostris darwini]
MSETFRKRIKNRGLYASSALNRNILTGYPQDIRERESIYKGVGSDIIHTRKMISFLACSTRNEEGVVINATPSYPSIANLEFRQFPDVYGALESIVYYELGRMFT